MNTAPLFARLLLLTAALTGNARAGEEWTVLDLGPYEDGRHYYFDGAGGIAARNEARSPLAAEAFRYDDPSRTYYVTDVNSARQFVGHSSPNHDCTALHHAGRPPADHAEQAFLWDAAGMLHVEVEGALRSQAYAINEAGTMVGRYTTADGERRAFRWSAGHALDLNRLLGADTDWVLHEGFDVDEDGRVVGFGARSGEFRLFLLAPAGAPPAEGPPPGGSATLNPAFRQGLPVLGWGVTAAVAVAPCLGDIVAMAGSGNAATGDCYDWGFEDGTLGGWTCMWGTYGGALGAVTCPNNNVVTTAGTDPLIPSLSTVSPRGATYSLRLGNSINGGQVDAITRTLTVPPSPEPVRIDYALVLEDPAGHVGTEPYFRVRAWSAGNSTPFYDVRRVSDVTDPFFTDVGGLATRDWSCLSIPVDEYVGESVSVLVEVADCGLGGHFGYAYVDVPCISSAAALPLSKCHCSNEPWIASPGSQVGVLSHCWRVERCDALGNPVPGTHEMECDPGPALTKDLGAFYTNAGFPLVAGQSYLVTLTLVTECETLRFTKVVRWLAPPNADAGPDQRICAGSSTTLTTSPKLGEVYRWYDPQGDLVGTGGSVVVTPTDDVTTYSLRVTRMGCESWDTVTVRRVYPLLAQVGECYCGNEVTLTAVTNDPAGATYTWLPSNQTGPSITVPVGSSVTLHAENECGAVTVSHTTRPPRVFSAPTLFIADGTNRFPIFHHGLAAGEPPAYWATEYRFEVINQWGEQDYAVVTGTLPACDETPNGTLPDWDGRGTSGHFLEGNEVYFFRFFLKCGETWQQVPVNNTLLTPFTYLRP